MLTIFWFRRDLRLDDNAGLYHALRSGYPVLPIFIFDEDILEKLPEKSDRRVNFIHEALQDLHQQLVTMGSSLLVLHGKPLDVWKNLCQEYNIAEVHTNHDYEKYAQERDKNIGKFLNEHATAFYTHKDQVIFEKNEVLSGAGTPYTVFTPYSRKWKEVLHSGGATSPSSSFYLKPYPTQKYFQNFFKTNPFELLSLDLIGFQATNNTFPKKEVKDLLLKNYGEKRDFPSVIGTSRLSVHLRFGTISIRALATAGLQSEKWLNELIWRDFYMNILWHFPHISEGKAFRKEYDNIAWRYAPEDFERWCEGKTGYPIVDAGMRELNTTGFMHNRVRMIVASFLCKHLLLDWRLGEAYFAQKLLDFDFSANNGGWQWASSSGCDAAPYFRIFNPTAQTQKFDPQLEYIKRWLPELSSFSYPKPIVEHTFARERALRVYKEGLQRI